MDRSSFAAVLTVVLLCFTGPATAAYQPSILDFGPQAQVAAPDAPPEPPPINESHRTGLRNQWSEDSSAAQALSTDYPTLIVQTNGVTTVRLDDLRELGATVEISYQDVVQITAPRSAIPEIRGLKWVQSVRYASSANPATVSEGVEVIGADRLHSLDVKGANVSVGIIDLGFNTSNPELTGNYTEAKTFTDSLSGTSPGHGTAVAEIVLDVAPNADLYLATIDTAVEFAAAIDWLESKDVDIITASVGWPGFGQGGSHLTAEAASSAVANGTVFTVAAGNHANEHWEGQFVDSDDDDYAEYTAGGIETNYLANGSVVSGSVDIRLSWDGWPNTTADYDLYLIDSSGNIVGYSTDHQYPDGGEPFEQIKGQLPYSDIFYVAVKQYNATGTERIELTALNYGLYYQEPNGSISPPATGRNVTAIGAFDQSDGQLEPFSSRGPTRDGRRGLDVVAPDGVSTTAFGEESFFGTSAAAPHVAGLSALLLADNESFRRADLVNVLRESADDAGPEGIDNQTGYGKVNATAAHRLANPHLKSVTLNRSTVVAGSAVQFTVTVENTADLNGSLTVPLSINGTTQTQTIVNVSSQSTASVVYEPVFGTAGTSTISVAYLPTRTVEVLDPANVTVVGLFAPDIVTANTSFTVNASVRNTGQVTAENYTLKLYMDGSKAVSRTTDITPGSETVSFNTSFENGTAVGNHTIVLGNQSETVYIRNSSQPLFINPIPDAGGDNPPSDPDGDGLYDDVNGDGEATFDDAIALAFASTGDLTHLQIESLDFDGDGDVDFDDAIELAFST